MIRAAICGLMIWGCFTAASTRALGEVTAEPSERGVLVKIDGQPFTEYLKLSGHMPALWPVIGPTGQPMTRSFPAGPRVPGESTDHPHHHSIWFTHGAVNGFDFWTHERNRPDARIVHRDFSTIESGPQAKIVSVNDWTADGKKICEDERTVTFGKLESGDRWIDYAVKLTATEGDLVLGDTKEGTFGVRVADSLRVEAELGGKIVNSHGQVDEAAWGYPAQWLDNSGPVEGETVGISMFSHPSSFRPVCRWHARAYGMLTANPFGEREFLAEVRRQRGPDELQQGAHTIPRGESLNFRYRVLLHRGDAEQAKVAEVFKAYAAEGSQPSAN
jgi:hypothetical protein